MFVEYKIEMQAPLSAGTKVPAQYVEALRTVRRESDLSDFQELRRGFIPAESNIWEMEVYA
jgi:hypothetical protein